MGIVPLGLAACGSAGTGTDRQAEAATVVEGAVVDAVPQANGAFVTTATSGPGNRTMLVRLYLDPTEAASLAQVVDRAADAAWASSPLEFLQLTVEAVEGDRPAQPPRGVEQVIDLRPVAAELGLDSRFVVDGRLMLSELFLQERYGVAGGESE